MSSQDNHGGHRDAAADREVVICHACSHERYRDQHGLMCPECQGEITQITDQEKYPRHLNHHPSASTSTEAGPYRYRDGDSEAEQGNIDDHLGSHGLGFQRRVRDGPDWRHHHGPAVEIGRINQGLAPLRRPGRPAWFPSSLSGRPGEHDLFPPHTSWTTFATEPLRDGVTPMPIVSGPIHGSRGGLLLTNPVADPLARPPPRRSRGQIGYWVRARGANQNARAFSDELRDAGTSGEDNQRGDEGPGAGHTDFIRSLHNILSFHGPANSTPDFTIRAQYALIQIVAGRIGVDTESNAAPPATEEALRDLKQKPVGKEMLGTEGKEECAICIDEMEEEDMAAILPCKHWFHKDCVVRWLRKHNTCPICRMPIEENHRGGHSSNSSSDSDNGSSRPHEPPSGHNSGLLSPSAPAPGFAGSSWFSGGSPDWGGSAENVGSSPNRPFRASRPPSLSRSRSNVTLGSISSTQQERGHDRDSATSSRFGYDDSRLRRPSSHSREHPGSSLQ